MNRQKRKLELEERGVGEVETTKYDKIFDVTNIVLDEWACPITLELPVRPVTAEDGHVYEEFAIRSWFEQNEDVVTKSPVTGQTIGKRLLPACQLKNTLLKLEESGILTGERVRLWKLGLKAEAEVSSLEKRAQAGETLAMRKLGFYYRDSGQSASNYSNAIRWLMQAAKLDDAPSITALGILRINGKGFPQNTQHAIEMLNFAAELGSEHACGILANSYDGGLFGLKVDWMQAFRFYEKMKECSHKDSNVEYREMARNFKNGCCSWRPTLV